MTRAPYDGPSRKLVLAFDIGTTYSGAAYAFLDPGEVPEIQSITRYLGNAKVGSAKVPSILYYDQSGNFRGVENGSGLQDDESLVQMRWWKLLLGPTGPPAALKKYMNTSLPTGKTIIDIFSDFMRYLFDSTKALFISSHQNGEDRWDSVPREIELVLTHPNEWGGSQQNQLRSAAVRAKIVPDTPEGRSRVHFMTEGEASFNFCATHTEAGENLKRGDTVLIVDAGGGTIDISFYSVTENSPRQVEELALPKCLLQGGEFVTARAKETVSEKLKATRFNTPEDISTFAQKFDDGLKKAFTNSNAIQHVGFGSPGDNDPKNWIRAGKLTLSGYQVAGFFEPSIQATVDSIREDFTEVLSLNSHAFLVGGFASSPRLTAQLDQRLSDLGLRFFKPDTSTDKAAAVGAISVYIDGFVRRRESRFTFGFPCSIVYTPFNPEHVKREDKTYIDIEGDKRVPDAFTTILSQGTRMLESQEISIRTKRRMIREGAPTKDVELKIVKYHGNQKEPRWMDIEQDKFETLCHIVADISALPCTRKLGTSGKLVYIQVFDVVLMVGLTELKAQIRWEDSKTGLERSSDAAILYCDV